MYINNIKLLYYVTYYARMGSSRTFVSKVLGALGASKYRRRRYFGALGYLIFEYMDWWFLDVIRFNVGYIFHAAQLFGVRNKGSLRTLDNIRGQLPKSIQTSSLG